MAKLDELTESQLHELKAALLLEREESVTFDEICRADEIVTDDEIKAKYGDDFPQI